MTHESSDSPQSETEAMLLEQCLEITGQTLEKHLPDATDEHLTLIGNTFSFIMEEFEVNTEFLYLSTELRL